MPGNPMKNFQQGLLDKEASRKKKMKSWGRKLMFWKSNDKDKENENSAEKLVNEDKNSEFRSTLEQAYKTDLIYLKKFHC